MKFLVFALFFPIAVQAAALPELLQKIEKKYRDAKTLSAEFTQVTESAATKQTKNSSGMFIVKMPHKLRWEVVKPDTSLLVSDGKTFWFYTPPFDASEHGQLIEKKTSQVQSQLAQALLSGKFSALKNSSIEPYGAGKFRISPKKGTAGDVTRAEIDVDSDTELVTGVKLDHEGGNKTEIELTKITLGQPLDDRLFTFIAPPNTDRVRE